MKSKSSVIRILFAASEQSADIFYLTKVFVPDPFLCFIVGGRSTAVVNRLEYSRVRAQSNCDEVLLLETVQRQAGKGPAVGTFGGRPCGDDALFRKVEQGA